MMQLTPRNDSSDGFCSRRLDGKVVTNGIDTPVENGLSQKEEGEEVQRLAAKVVDNVVKLASEAADQRSRGNSPAKRLPTIQIDTVPTLPWSPTESLSNDEDQPLDAGQIDLQLEEEEHQPPDALSEELREELHSFIEDILSKAMVVVEKKLQFVGIDDDDDEEEAPVLVQEESQPVPSTSEPDSKPEEEEVLNDAEIREAAEKVVGEVLTRAQETAAERMELDVSALDFPGLPTFQIDTVKSAPPSPEMEVEPPQKQKKWSFKVNEDSRNSTSEPIALITFDEAPEDVQDVASSFIKEIVGKAITMAEEKAVPTVPFNFEDVDLIKTSGPWYVRVREGFMRVLRSACFCTPRRNDS